MGVVMTYSCLWFSIADWLAETQFDHLECRDPLHVGRAGYSYCFAALNVGLQAAAKTPFASWAASRTEERIERMKDVITAPPDHQHSTAGSFVVRDVRKTDTSVQECCGSTGTSLSLSAIRLSSGSERAFILCIRRLRCTFTVASAMPISPAICLLRRPCAT